jgi:glycosyltransferase involved in cell wall biosynthesis
MTVGYFLKFSTRIFTRHHGSIHHLKAQRFSTLIDIVTSFFATKVIAVSQCTRAILHEKERVPQHKIKLIHNGIDLSRFTNPKVIDSRKNRDSDRRKSQMFRIGVVSRTEDWKSVHQIAKAFRIFLRNTVNAELIIVGAPGNAENLLASELKDIPSDNYQRIPFINDIEAFFSEIDLFVHVPTGECVEAFGLVYLEALASGVPSIFSINGILTEIHFSDSRNALVPSGEEFKLERHIYEAYLKWRDGTQQRERDVEITKFIGHFSIDRMVSQYLKLFYQ